MIFTSENTVSRQLGRDTAVSIVTMCRNGVWFKHFKACNAVAGAGAFNSSFSLFLYRGVQMAEGPNPGPTEMNRNS